MSQFSEYFEKELLQACGRHSGAMFYVIRKLEEVPHDRVQSLIVFPSTLTDTDVLSAEDLAVVTALDRLAMAIDGTVSVVVPNEAQRAYLRERTSMCVSIFAGEQTRVLHRLERQVGACMAFAFDLCSAEDDFTFLLKTSQLFRLLRTGALHAFEGNGAREAALARYLKAIDARVIKAEIGSTMLVEYAA